MAQKCAQLDRETISCSICLDYLKDPMIIPCGHNFCMNCIESYWDGEDVKKTYCCPQCRQSFTSRPALLKNTMLAVLVEQLKETGLQAPPADHCYAGPEDVACDVCTGRKLKALKSCLVCLVSYCERHLQPHFESSAFEKHKLVDPSKKLPENICSRHDEVMKIFCRTDQQCICYLCSMDEHKGHDTVSAAAERAEKQKELEVSRQNIQQKIQESEKNVKDLQQEMEAINRSADKAVGDSEKIFTELIRLIETQVRSKQETELSRTKELQEKLEQEITEMKRRDAELMKLSHTEDHNQFLHRYPSLSALSESTHSSSVKIQPQSYFEDVTAEVSKVRDKLQAVLMEKQTEAAVMVIEADVLEPLDLVQCAVPSRISPMECFRNCSDSDLLEVEEPVSEPELEPVLEPVSELEPVLEPVSELEPVLEPVSELEPVLEPVSELEPVFEFKPFSKLVPVSELEVVVAKRIWPISNPTPHRLTDLVARSREVRERVRAVPSSDHQVRESVNKPLLPLYRKSALVRTPHQTPRLRVKDLPIVHSVVKSDAGTPLKYRKLIQKDNQ